MIDYTRKAKIKDSNEWVIGYHVYVDYLDKHYILVSEKTHDGFSGMLAMKQYEVDEDTICNPTGLTDKNGNKIWENDIIGYWDTYSTENGQAEADCIGKVFWDDETLSFQVTERLSAESYEVMDECSVIGNIFDNADLLKVE